MEYLLTEKYKPETIQNVILPEELAKSFAKMVEEQNIPNMTFAGTSGIGKSTVARALLKQMQVDYIVQNGSMKGIDALRTDVMDFISTVSFTGKRKYVLIEEADGMTARMQDGLRDLIEEFSANAGFILTCNRKNKIIDAIQSRCPPVDFTIPKDERSKLAARFFVRLEEILKIEEIPYEKEVLAEVVKRYFPDFRKTLNVLQRYSKTGSIDAGILARGISIENVSSLIDSLRERDYTTARKWIGENSDIDSGDLYRSLYDELPKHLSGSASIASAIMVLAEYEYKEAFVANPEINRAAAIASLMAECQWK